MTSPIRGYYTSTTDAWEAMLNACAQASSSIYMEEYVFEPDTIGNKFMDIFIEKARAGAEVRLLLDWWGCKRIKSHSVLNRLSEAGITVRFFRPPEWQWLYRSPRFLPRDHRKIFLIDGKRAFAGGVCINDRYADWRDTMVEVSDTLVEQLHHVFEQTWRKTEIDERKALAHPDFSTLENYSVFANAPDSDEHKFIELLRNKLDEAKQSIKLITPYFTPDDNMINLLQSALSRDVSVELLLSRYSKYSTYVVGKKMCGPLLEAGAIVRYYQPSMLHLKTMLVDESWCAIGSSNLDGLSLHHNQEVMLTSTDKSFVNELLSHYEADIAKAQKFTLSDWQNRRLSEKLMGQLLSVFKHYL